MSSRNWSRQETLAAFAIYCRTPFGRLHSRNPDIVALANRLGRTASAVAMKCCNLASLDDAHTRRGVSGLTGVSRTDREIWNEFRRNPEQICFEAVTCLAGHLESPLVMPEDQGLPEVIGEDREAIRRIRMNQWFFREMILASYAMTCAVCRLAIGQLVVAAHIVPWSMDRTTRMNPTNGLCLCGTHDLAYERGVLLVLPDYSIRVAAQYGEFRGSEPADIWLFRYDGERLHLPERWPPDPQLLSRRLEASCAR
jgi:putative restriction endonuclease